MNDLDNADTVNIRFYTLCAKAVITHAVFVSFFMAYFVAIFGFRKVRNGYKGEEKH